MIIDTFEEAVTMRRTKSLIIIICLVSILLTIIFSMTQKKADDDLVVFGFKLTVATIIIYSVSASIVIFIHWFHYNIKYTYFYFSNNGKSLLFKFYNMRFLSGKPQAIEIPKSMFFRYEIESGFFNKRKSLVLYQKSPKGVGKYPPISLSLLSKKQFKELRTVLNSYISK